MGKTLTLKQTGFYVMGSARLLLWRGDEVWVNMNPFHVMSLDEIPGKVNDGEFGCQRILEAECDVYEDYEGTHRWIETRNYEGDELLNAKTGV